MLPSGLPEMVGDEEDLDRFLTQSNFFDPDLEKAQQKEIAIQIASQATLVLRRS